MSLSGPRTPASVPEAPSVATSRAAAARNPRRRAAAAHRSAAFLAAAPARRGAPAVAAGAEPASGEALRAPFVLPAKVVSAGPARPGGFTLIELMVVMALMGGFLLLVPIRLSGFGARSRLESGGNTIISALPAAKEQAIIDGNVVYVEFDLEKNAYRYQVSTRTHESPEELASQEERERDEERRRALEDEEEEWIYTAWTTLPDGVKLAGFSTDREQWVTTNPGGAYPSVMFLPDGSVRPPHAVFLEGDPDLPERSRSLTIMVNALTSLAEVTDGKSELPRKRTSDDFR